MNNLNSFHLRGICTSSLDFVRARLPKMKIADHPLLFDESGSSPFDTMIEGLTLTRLGLF
jgi:hypothetical protein